jgi:hypothetical protein
MMITTASIGGIYLALSRNAAGEVTSTDYIVASGLIEMGDGETTGNVLLKLPVVGSFTVTITVNREEDTFIATHDSQFDIYGVNCQIRITNLNGYKRKSRLSLSDQLKPTRNTYNDFHSRKAGHYSGSRK